MKKIVGFLLGLVFLLLAIRFYLGYCVVVQCKFVQTGLFETVRKLDLFANKYQVGLLPGFSRNLLTQNDNKPTGDRYSYVNWGILQSVDLDTGEMVLTDVYGYDYVIVVPELRKNSGTGNTLKSYYINENRMVVETLPEEIEKIGKGNTVVIYWKGTQPVSEVIMTRLFREDFYYSLPEGAVDRIFMTSKLENL